MYDRRLERPCKKRAKAAKNQDQQAECQQPQLVPWHSERHAETATSAVSKAVGSICTNPTSSVLQFKARDIRQSILSSVAIVIQISSKWNTFRHIAILMSFSTVSNSIFALDMETND